MLARADASDPTLSNLSLVFSCLIVLGVTSFLGFLVFRSARLRRRAQTELFGAVAVLWIALSAGLGIYDLSMQSKWSHESATRLQSGYYTPAEIAADAPSHPWALYAALAAGYFVLLFAASRPIRYAR